jgi:hypothetical protein
MPKMKVYLDTSVLWAVYDTEDPTGDCDKTFVGSIEKKDKSIYPLFPM